MQTYNDFFNMRIILTLHAKGIMAKFNSLIIDTDYKMVGKDYKMVDTDYKMVDENIIEAWS